MLELNLGCVFWVVARSGWRIETELSILESKKVHIWREDGRCGRGQGIDSLIHVLDWK